MTTDDQITVAKRWAERLDINDWPTIWRVDDIAEPDITIGARDIVTIPATATTEAEIGAVVLAYAYHNVPEDQHPSEQQLQQAANAMAVTYGQIGQI
jgi:hypothetical protein